MKLEIIQDSEDVAFCLFEGSYSIQIPKERCKIKGIKIVENATAPRGE